MLFLFIALLISFLNVEAYHAKLIAATSASNATEGYVYIQFYTSDNCEGSKSFVEGYYADYCYQISSSSFRKYKFSKEDCSDLYQLQYSDSICSILVDTIYIGDSYSTCTNTEDEGSVAAGSSYEGYCYLGTEVLAPMDGYIHSYYDSSVCDTTVVQYNIYGTDLCADVTGMDGTNTPTSYYSTCSSEYNNVTTKSYYDEGVCSDLYDGIEVVENYECIINGKFYNTQSCITAAPQGTDGYVYTQYYTEAGCSGNRSAADGYYGDYCYHEGGDVYYKYYFSKSDCSDLVKRMYSDSLCFSYKNESSMSSFVECTDVDGGYPAAASYKGFCSLGETIPAQMAGYIKSDYIEEGCSTVIHYELYSTNLCVDLTTSDYGSFSVYATCSDNSVESDEFGSWNCSSMSFINSTYESLYTCSSGTDDDDSVVNPNGRTTNQQSIYLSTKSVTSTMRLTGSLQDPYRSMECVDGPPTGTEGYIFYQYYDQKNCDGTKSFNQGLYAEVCLAGDDGYYSKYFFSQEDCSDLVERIYSDSACTIFVEETSFSSFSECNDVAGGFPAGSSFKGFCSLGSTIPIPMDGFMMSYFFDQKNCTKTYRYDLYATELCVDLTYPYETPQSEYATCNNNGSAITRQSYNDGGVCYIVDKIDSIVTNTYQCDIADDSTTSTITSSSSKKTSLLTKKLNEQMIKASSSSLSSKLVANALKKMNSDTSNFYTSLSCEVGVPLGTEGYVYQQYYNAIECDGNKTFAQGYYGDYCYSALETDNSTIYFKYQFSQGDCSDLKKLYYFDSNCFKYNNTEILDTFSVCDNVAGNIDAALSVQGFCSLGKEISTQMPGFLETFYDEVGCDTAIEYQLYATNQCEDLTGIYDQNTFYSEYATCSMDGVLTINSYLSQNCTNFYDAITKNVYECKVGTNDDDYDEFTSIDTSVIRSIYDSVTSNSRIKSTHSSSTSKSLVKRRKLASFPVDKSYNYNYSSLSCVQETPSGTDGYVFYQYYTGGSCGGDKSFVEGYYANYCYQVGTHYRKFYFSNEDCSDLVQRDYSDAECSVMFEESSDDTYTKCFDTSDTYPAVSSYKGFCSFGNSIPVTMDGFIESDSEGECEYEIIFRNYATDLCVDLTLSGEQASEYATCNANSTVTRQYYNETNICYPSHLVKETNIDDYTCTSPSEETKKSPLISLSQYTQKNPKSLFYNLQTTSRTTTSTTTTSASNNTIKQSYYCVEGPNSGTDGYFYQQFYDADSCGGDMTFTEGFYGDYCSSDDMGAYYKLQFNDGDCSDLTMLMFSDYNCLHYNYSMPFVNNTDCQNSDSTSSPAMSSYNFFCSLSNTIPIPMDGFIESSYIEGDCVTAYSYNIKATDICQDITGLYSNASTSFYATCSGSGINSSAIHVTRYSDDNTCTTTGFSYNEEVYTCEIRGDSYYNSAESSDSYQSKHCVKKADQGTDGYVYYQYYASGECTGSKSYAEGYYANYCYNEGDFYRKFHFTKEDCSDLIVREYTDSACLILFKEINGSAAYDTCYIIDDPYFPAASSYQGFCSLGNTIPVPMDGFMRSQYATDDCGVPTSYNIKAINLCVDLTVNATRLHSEYATCTSAGSTDDGDSYYITRQVYNDSSTCNATTYSVKNSIASYSCEDNTDDDHEYHIDDDLFDDDLAIDTTTSSIASITRVIDNAKYYMADGYEQLSQARQRIQVKQVGVHVGSTTTNMLGASIILSSLYCLNSNMEPSAAPTMKPSYAAGSPTPKPTSFSGVEFTATQDLSGISLSDYTNNENSYSPILKKSIAASMKNDLITSDNVLDLVASSSRRKLDISLIDMIVSTTSSSSSIKLSYLVKSYSSGVSYSTLSKTLKDSVSNGYFNSNLKSTASASGSSQLASCTSSTVDTQDTTPTDDDNNNNNDDDDEGLSDGAIAGIVIGVTAFFLLVFVGIYYYTNIKKNPLLSNNSSNNNSSGSKSERGVEDTENPMTSAKKSNTRALTSSLGRESLAGPPEISPSERLSSIGGGEVDL